MHAKLPSLPRFLASRDKRIACGALAPALATATVPTGAPAQRRHTQHRLCLQHQISCGSRSTAAALWLTL
jgi:hypothetical protein